MSFTSVSFALFVPICAIVYYCVPKRLQNYILSIASIAFYTFNLPKGNLFGKNPMPLLLLLTAAFFVFYVGRKIDSVKNKKLLLTFSICVLLGVLAVFKYAGYLIPVLFEPNIISSLAFPLGISYFTFMAVSYLVDVYRKDILPENSFVKFFAFISFFGSITAGPICRARVILPQLSKPRTFCASKCADALRLALIGFFKQLAVANILGLCLNIIFENSQNYNGGTLILAMLLYSAQLYFEFSGYSDLALATGRIFGLDLPQNFKTPYFATNFSGFWARWHISLSTWLQDYIFMPLVWGRWTSRIPVLGKHFTNPPVLLSVAIVFFISGIWHGNTWPFVIWGSLMAVYRVGEELLHQLYKKPKKKPSPALRVFKSVGVYALWSVGLVFFRFGKIENGVSKAFLMLKNSLNILNSNVLADFNAAIQTGFYPKPVMVNIYLVFTAFVLLLGFALDWYQCFKLKDKHISTAFLKLPIIWRWTAYYLFIGIILLSYIMQSGGFGGNISAPYANF